jgi:Ferritin-like domain
MTKKEMNKYASRRNWCVGSAALLGVGAISSIPARAQQTPQTAFDITLLNFALRLENLQSAFYQQGLAMFTPADFQNSVAVQTIGGNNIGASIYSYISGFAQIEQNHIAAIIQLVYELDGTPQAPDCYNFGITTVDSFLQMAQTIENIGVMAYAGVVVPQFQTSNATVTSFAIQSMVATIATVEARHAAYFNLVNLMSPFPTALDSTLTAAQTLSAISPFLIAGCSGPAVPLTLAVAGPAKNSIITTNQTMVQLDASLSTSATSQPLNYLWQQDLGSPNSKIIDITSVTATTILLGGAGVYTVTLKVTDSLGGSDQDTLKIIFRP